MDLCAIPTSRYILTCTKVVHYLFPESQLVTKVTLYIHNSTYILDKMSVIFYINFIQESQNIQFQSKISVIPHYRPFFVSQTFIFSNSAITDSTYFLEKFLHYSRTLCTTFWKNKMTHNINNKLALCFVLWQKIRLVTFLKEFWVMPIFVHS